MRADSIYRTILMKRSYIFISLSLIFLSGCSPHFHLDLLGKQEIAEVVLEDSAVEAKIALLDIAGAIESSSGLSLWDKEGDVVSRIYYRLQQASRDNKVKAIILRLDTPGGEVTASDILYNEIREFRQRTGRPVIALLMGTAASGGYYIASACDYIIAHPATITGSIGVISVFPNLGELMDKLGIQVNVIKSGAMKDSGSFLRDMKEAERELFQTIIDSYYARFLEIVYSGRRESIPMEHLKTLADGRIYTAQQALAENLVDEIGYFRAAKAKALAMAGIKQAKVVAYSYYPDSKTNIYASDQSKPPLMEKKGWEQYLASLKSGFYYLWLPEYK